MEYPVSDRFDETELRGKFAILERVNGKEGSGILPVELPDEPLSEEPLELPEALLSAPAVQLEEVSPDAEPDASPEVEALLSPVALPLASAEPLPEEVAEPP
jgi:hypothetical protein